jgi:hypothetical protein
MSPLLVIFRVLVIFERGELRAGFEPILVNLEFLDSSI